MTSGSAKKSADRAQEIYLAAAQLFFEKGFESTSVSDIANALSLTKASLYYYVESKQDLLYRIVSLGLDSVQDQVLDPAKSIADAEERLRFIVLNHSRLAASGNHAVIIISHEMNSLKPDQRAVVQRRRREYFDFVRNTLVDLQQHGKLKHVNITTATFTLFGMILWLPRWYRSSGLLQLDVVCNDICNLALNGLIADKPELADGANTGN